MFSPMNHRYLSAIVVKGLGASSYAYYTYLLKLSNDNNYNMIQK